MSKTKDAILSVVASRNPTARILVNLGDGQKLNSAGEPKLRRQYVFERHLIHVESIAH